MNNHCALWATAVYIQYSIWVFIFIALITFLPAFTLNCQKKQIKLHFNWLGNHCLVTVFGTSINIDCNSAHVRSEPITKLSVKIGSKSPSLV